MVAFRVDSEHMGQALAGAQSSLERVRVEASGLTTQLTGLEGSWQGDAAVAFQDLVQRWRATQAHVEESAASINAALSSAAQSYGATESEVRGLFAA